MQHEANIKNQIDEIGARRTTRKSELEVRRKNKTDALTLQSKEQAFYRTLKQAEYDLLKQRFADPNQAKLAKLECIKQIYSRSSIRNFSINHMSSEEPITDLIEKFAEIVN